ncbi:uncharacterized protein MONOS_9781 [Monocercomonoides exilis]|uniref:uncharacterized protein n=1 Tax=Monocercomonoides exilis TaxID=2049356 RepID=UPI003559C04D|nr:hypothetical protein MONOS_9781 [Monocercomonoides exilis]|eukprot:MONOS_9781.1-p1 / transcript=MONOS_9781.1 / gene=MONOS_9781 / organism=Monocercomonoides_exilis_PA203 / gene_product=unspecified product / transcript_product=unspecified product / location=Mono_scaffold00417:5257-6030(+) / protein_length=258 / sequence_SO=supercontig / SO=protein_coding / is_pseudo=false
MGLEEARGKEAALYCETEREEREANYYEMNIQRETVAPGEKRSEMEIQKQSVNIGKVVSMLDQENERERETTEDRVMERPREEAQHEATRTEGDSAYLRVTRQKSERRNEKIVWRTSGIVIGSPIGSTLEEGSKTVVANIYEGEEKTQMQSGHKTLGVKRRTAIGPLREPLPGRLVNRLSEWKKIGGDKLVSRGIITRWRSPQSPISLEERRHKQKFRRTTEMTNNYLSLLEEELKDRVMKPVQESEGSGSTRHSWR